MAHKAVVGAAAIMRLFPGVAVLSGQGSVLHQARVGHTGLGSEGPLQGRDAGQLQTSSSWVMSQLEGEGMGLGRAHEYTWYLLQVCYFLKNDMKQICPTQELIHLCGVFVNVL